MELSNNSLKSSPILDKASFCNKMITNIKLSTNNEEAERNDSSGDSINKEDLSFEKEYINKKKLMNKNNNIKFVNKSPRLKLTKNFETTGNKWMDLYTTLLRKQKKNLITNEEIYLRINKIIDNANSNNRNEIKQRKNTLRLEKEHYIPKIINFLKNYQDSSNNKNMKTQESPLQKRQAYTTNSSPFVTKQSKNFSPNKRENPIRKLTSLKTSVKLLDKIVKDNLNTMRKNNKQFSVKNLNVIKEKKEENDEQFNHTNNKNVHRRLSTAIFFPNKNINIDITNTSPLQDDDKNSKRFTSKVMLHSRLTSATSGIEKYQTAMTSPNQTSNLSTSKLTKSIKVLDIKKRSHYESFKKDLENNIMEYLDVTSNNNYIFKKSLTQGK